MATNRVTGMYSGLDTESLISQLVEAKSVKVDAVRKDQLRLKYKQEAWTDLNKKVKSLFSNISNLKYESSYAKRKTNISDSRYAEVVTSDNAMLSTQSLKIRKLAKSAYLTGDAIELKVAEGETEADKATSGTLVSSIKTADGESLVGKTISITANGKTTDVTITEDMTMSGLSSKLSGAGVTCNFDSATQRFFIGAKASGKAGDFTISGSAAADLGLANTEHKIPGEDAEIELNGVTYKSNTNTIEVNGLTITAKEETEGEDEITLSTVSDTSAVYDMIKKFVKEYSSLMNEMDKLYNASTDTKYDPLTDEEKAAMSDYEIEQWEGKLKEQILAKDSTINSVSSSIRDIVNQGITINDKTYYLFNFGIETAGYFESADNEKNMLHIKGDADDSLYSTETNTLQYMISSDPDLVTKFFSEMTKNLSTKMDEMSTRVNETRSYGSFYDDIKMKSDYSDFSEKIADMEDKLAAYEDKWYDKFSAMETAMAKMQSNQNAISSLLGG